MARVIVCPGQGCGHHNPISDGSFPNTCAKCQASLLGQIPVDPEDVGVQGSSNSAERSGQACPRCRGRNPKDAGVCVFCGAPMSAGMSREPAAPQSPLPVDLARRFDVVEVLPAHSAEADLFVVQPRVGGPTKFLKLYRQGLNPDREVLRRLQAASADHVVRIDEFGEVATGGGMRFFEVQELLPLGSLRAELSQRGKWLPQRVEDLVREMVEALGHLEVSGLRHGDVKPENIMFRAKAPMDLVLTDFGGVQITHASVHVGQLGVFSIDYVAPEAAVGSKDDGRTLHRKSDYFSLGVIVAECLLGRHPVRLESAHARSAVLVKSGAPTDELPERFALLVQGLTAVDPAVRFGKQEVDRWLARDPTLLAPKIVEPQSDGKPYIFNKKPYYNLDALADGMHDAPAVGALWIEGGYLARGLSDHFKDHDRAFTVENIAREHGSGPVVLMYCLQVLSPRDYPRLLGVELTHENLAVASAQAVKGDEAAKRLVDLLWNEQILARFPERAEPGIKNPDAYRSIDAAWRKHVADFESTAADLNKHVNAEDRLSAQAPRELRYHALAWAASAQHCTQAAADLTAQLEESRWPAWFANAVSASATRPGALLALSKFAAAVRRAAPAGSANAANRSTTKFGLGSLGSNLSQSLSNLAGRVLLVGVVLAAGYWLVFVYKGGTIHTRGVAPSAPATTSSLGGSSDTSSEPSRSMGIEKLLVEVQSFAETETAKVLAVARKGNGPDIEAAALRAGRGFDFTPYHVTQDAALASRLNAQALAEFNTKADVVRAYNLQREAFRANPLNSEVAGNFAIYAQRVSSLDEALSAVYVALSLSRPPNKTSRTADWATLAAIYAKQGDTDRAADALYVTLGMAPDVGKRCYSAIYSTMYVYGDELRPVTERMLARVREQDLSRAPACRLPVDWSTPPSQVKFESNSKLTINGMDPVRLGFGSEKFKSIFGRSLSLLDCVPGPHADLRTCAIRDNFLGDVNGSLVVRVGGGIEERIVGISIDDPAISTPSQVKVGGSIDDIQRAYGSKFVLETVGNNLIRLPGTGSDIDFELRFGLRDRHIVNMAAVVSSAYAHQAANEPAFTRGSASTDQGSVAFSIDLPFTKTMNGQPYSSPRLSIPEGARAREYDFLIQPVNGAVDVNVTATRGNFTYASSSRGIRKCQLGPWKSVQISNISAQSIKVTLRKRRSMCS